MHPYKRKKRGRHSDIQRRMSFDAGDRDQSFISSGQGSSNIAGRREKQRMNTFFLKGQRILILFLKASKRNQHFRHFDFGLLDSRTGRQYVFFFFGVSHLVCGNLLRQSWETNADSFLMPVCGKCLPCQGVSANS